MQIRILGTAAGGGFPQWNCRCRNCRRLREGKLRASPRSQAQVAISSDGSNWYLLNASPDLRYQIEASPALHPRTGPFAGNGRLTRDSPVAGVVLTGGDLDQVLGLLLLRELQPLRIYAAGSVRSLLLEDNTVFAALSQVPEQTLWTEIIPGREFELESVCGMSSGIRCRAIAQEPHFPAYVPPGRRSMLNPSESELGLALDAPDGGRLLYMPSVADVDDAGLELMQSADVLLFDGTFWSDDELKPVTGRTARQMGHLPVGGPGGSLERLAALTRPQKIYSHINHTNPMLDEDSREYHQVREAGWRVAEDGWQLEL